MRPAAVAVSTDSVRDLKPAPVFAIRIHDVQHILE